MRSRTIRAIACCLLAGTVGLCASACSDEEAQVVLDEQALAQTSGTDDAVYEAAFYDNNDFNDYATGGSPVIEGQWPAYGTGDPYILRHNGMYYLYVSTTTNGGGTTRGVRGWKSPDLVHWEQCQGEGLALGYVAGSDVPNTEGAYAPEVYYYDGYFYMYESRYTREASGGEGHYVLRASSPEGPFELITDTKLDTHIDASVLLDSAERGWFFTAASGYIRVSEMTSMSSINYSDTAVSGTDRMGGWTEGPRVIEYLGKYYLTYTGLHVGTPGYQVCYAVSDGWEEESVEAVAASFKVGAKQAMLLNADPDNGFTGLGHSSSVLGPDLDSWYISYHCLNSRSGPNRSVNIDRLLFSQDLMTTHHNRYSSVAPTLPEFYTYTSAGLTGEGEMLLSQSSSEDTFSAEFNMSGVNEGKAVFAWQDAQNYAYAGYDLTGHKVYLRVVEGGDERTVAEAELYNDYSADATHTLRIAYRDGKCNVHFDDMAKIRNAAVTLSGGRVGYVVQDGLRTGYTCFSNVAMGTSDMREIKQAAGDTPATAYMQEGQLEGVGSYRFGEGSGARTVTSEGEYDGSGEVVLANAYDYARYLLYFQNTATYGMELVLGKQYAGRQIVVQIDGGEHQLITVPDASAADGDYVRVLMGEFRVGRGVHQVKIQSCGKEVAWVSLSFSEVTTQYSFSASLENERVRGVFWADDSDWSFTDGALYTPRGVRNFMSTEEKNIADFEMSVEMSLVENNSIFGSVDECGIIFRQRNYASYLEQINNPTASVWADRYKHVQGYYLSFTTTRVVLSRYDFGNVKSVTLHSQNLETVGGEYYTVRVVMRGNTIEVYRNGEQLFTYTDALALCTGACGLYATGGSAHYKNFTVNAL